ncbi:MULTISPECIES: hypothetical protein [Sphingomonas]|uniref:hypothetical protein n=1 Tax=Sphingomonas TaxID=13687 RepID=UPI001269DBF7|nr:MULTISPECIES: hypothetical protein [Sphingomonas]
MLSTLVDNSTLTAVQRTIGDIGVSRSYPFEGDLSAYDNYLQSLLIYDEVACPDDYKDEFKSDRRDCFSEVRFLSTSDLPYDVCEEASVEASEALKFSVTKGEISPGPLRDFLSSLDLHVSPAWYMNSSKWFLQMRLLADQAEVDLPKYGKLMSVLKSQTLEADKSEKQIPSATYIEASDGRVIDENRVGDGSIREEVKQFASGLNWIVQRSIFYTVLAKQLESAFTLHPIRHAFVGQYLIDNLVPQLSNNLRANAVAFFRDEIVDLSAKSDELLGSALTPLRLPFFAAWAVAEAGNPRDGYKHVLQVRHAEEARALRSRFREIEELGEVGDYDAQRRSAAKLRAAIREDLESLKRRYFGRAASGSADIKIDLLTLRPSLTVSNVWQKIAGHLPLKDRKAVTLLRSIGRDIMRAPTMGQLSDRFMASRKIRAGTGHNLERPRMEAKRYARSSTHFKQPL